MPPVFGGAPSCPRCRKPVYFAEQTLGPGGAAFHKLCLKCVDCGKLLEPRLLVDHDGEAYCKPCHSRSFGAKGYGAGGALVGEYAPRSSPSRPSPAAASLPPPKPDFDEEDTRDSPFVVRAAASMGLGERERFVAEELRRRELPQPVPPQEEAEAISLRSPSYPAPTPAVEPAPPASAAPPRSSAPLEPAQRPPPPLAPKPSFPSPSFSSSAAPPTPPRPTIPSSPSRSAGHSASRTGLGAGLGARNSKDLCPRCGTVVYFAEEVRAAGGRWHKRCLRCTSCSTSLSPSLLAEKDGEPFCRKCYSERFGLGGQGVMSRPSLF